MRKFPALNPALLAFPMLMGGTLFALLGQVDLERGTDLGPPAPEVPIEPALLEDWRDVPGWNGLACSECHSTVAREWAASAHGLAWVDRDYIASRRRKRRPESCLACHIPQPLLMDGELAEKVRARDPQGSDAHFGVTCATCHRGPDGVVLGPWGASTQAHVSRRSEYHMLPEGTGDGFDPGPEETAASSVSSNDLCARCHSTTIGPVIGIAKDFADLDKGRAGLSCVGCHMAPVQRRWAQTPAAAEGTDGADSSVPVRWGRSHALQTPRDPSFLRRAFGWTWEGEAGQQRLLLENRAGHRVPGAVGRYLDFTITALGADGQALGVQTLALDSSAFLPVNGSRAFAMPSGATGVLVVGEHEDPRSDRAVEFLRLTLP